MPTMTATMRDEALTKARDTAAFLDQELRDAYKEANRVDNRIACELLVRMIHDHQKTLSTLASIA